MFMLYAVWLGLLSGLALRGHLDGLSRVRLRWISLALAALVVQLILFSGPVTDVIGDRGAILYIASSALVLVVVLRNVRVPGLSIVALGAASNLAAILANGGWMPADPGALASLGKNLGTGYSNSREFAAPALPALTDIFALPRWLPFTNVFSIGDVLIGVGVFMAIVIAMRTALPPVPTGNSPDPPTADGTDGSYPGPIVTSTFTSVRGCDPTRHSVQGKPVARQGRKARGLLTARSEQMAQLPEMVATRSRGVRS